MTLNKLFYTVLIASLVMLGPPQDAAGQGPGRGGGAAGQGPGGGQGPGRGGGQQATVAPPGPPAAVPPAVAIARPTSDEIEAVRRALARFTESTDAATRTILGKYPGLVELRT